MVTSYPKKRPKSTLFDFCFILGRLPSTTLFAANYVIKCQRIKLPIYSTRQPCTIFLQLNLVHYKVKIIPKIVHLKSSLDSFHALIIVCKWRQSSKNCHNWASLEAEIWRTKRKNCCRMNLRKAREMRERKGNPKTVTNSLERRKIFNVYKKGISGNIIMSLCKTTTG